MKAGETWVHIEVVSGRGPGILSDTFKIPLGSFWSFLLPPPIDTGGVGRCWAEFHETVPGGPLPLERAFDAFAHGGKKIGAKEVRAKRWASRTDALSQKFGRSGAAVVILGLCTALWTWKFSQFAQLLT